MDLFLWLKQRQKGGSYFRKEPNVLNAKKITIKPQNDTVSSFTFHEGDKVNMTSCPTRSPVTHLAPQSISTNCEEQEIGQPVMVLNVN